MKREAYNFGYGTFQFSQDRYFMNVWKEGLLVILNDTTVNSNSNSNIGPFPFQAHYIGPIPFQARA